MYKGPSFSTSSPTLVIMSFFIIAIQVCVRWDLTAVLILIFLMANSALFLRIKGDTIGDVSHEFAFQFSARFAGPLPPKNYLVIFIDTAAF